MSDQWLEWAKRIQSISQAGLTFSKDVFDIERYEELQKLSAEIIASYTNTEMNHIIDLFKQEKGYQTPKVDVRGVVFKDGKLLLVKEKHDDKWALPGGFCEVGLSPRENAVKEIKEEAGYDVTATKLLAVLDMNKHPHPPQPYHYYKLFIQCDIVGGEALIGTETSDVNFFSETNLPALSTSRNTLSQLQMLFEYERNANKPITID
ncbi:NUDIX hydrolase [Metabacillus iocasae]|uniref:ADP-ribose pyrophosphatase YjhB (NUDIX family) n=1 Tax=Priestia iocasae TaxID=2291674 RepID=A0ABS2QUA7_9BACI|nr:NUDIX hydrolase [Metabacillus iocasae]MBM7702783.1 ADP-ribose pyrophosphatase YjhB (NUDIX family) [Metabacillus iocasae]